MAKIYDFEKAIVDKIESDIMALKDELDSMGIESVATLEYIKKDCQLMELVNRWTELNKPMEKSNP
jgi:hypothetical protein